jgi:type I restriction enzyme, S subunit
VTFFRQVPVKYLATFNNSVLSESTPGDREIEYIEISDVDSTNGVTGTTSYTFSDAPSRARRCIRTDDILISTVRTYLKAIARVDPAYDGAIASTGFCVLRPSAIHPRFLGYAVLAPSFVDEVIANSVGISYPAINASDLVRIQIPVPSPKEQEVIANFLDGETAQIDDLIGKQESLIDLLIEKRQATITRAVTKGLDSTAPTKLSGIPWLGDIPEQWDVSKIRYVADTIIGLTYSPDDVSNDGTLVLRSGNVQGGELVSRDDVFVSKPIAQKLILTTGDIVMCARNGSASLVGKNGVVTDEFAGSTFGAFMTAIRSNVNPWLRWVFASSLFGFQLGSFSTSTINQLTNATLNDFDVPMPPAKEMGAICEYLASECATIDKLRDTAVQAVALLHERRSALISAAVTGKIDVQQGVEQQ